MQIRVLGCAGGWPSAGRACSGYLVTEGATCLWLDAGAGTLAELLCHVSPRDVDALWISHLHPDHCSDLGAVRNLLAYGGARDGRPLPVHGPPGWPQWFDAAVPDSRATAAVFEMHELQDRSTVAIGDLRLTPFAVRHGVVTFACRVESDGAVFAYSADSGPCPSLTELCRGADLFACESFRSLPDAGDSDTVMTPEQAAAIAVDGGARSLLLTHLHPAADPDQALARARGTFGGPVAVARQGMVYQAVSPATGS